MGVHPALSSAHRVLLPFTIFFVVHFQGFLMSLDIVLGYNSAWTGYWVPCRVRAVHTVDVKHTSCLAQQRAAVASCESLHSTVLPHSSLLSAPSLLYTLQGSFSTLFSFAFCTSGRASDCFQECTERNWSCSFKSSIKILCINKHNPLCKVNNLWDI